MPAPAVIPALLAYIEVDAVKTLVVGAVRLEENMLEVSNDFGDSTASLSCA